MPVDIFCLRTGVGADRQPAYHGVYLFADARKIVSGGDGRGFEGKVMDPKRNVGRE